MPTSSGEYVGDQAGVLPSNTAAMLHFSDQFAQMAAQRRAQQAAQQREDENRKIALQKYLGTSLDNKEFNTQTDAQGVITTNLQDLRNKATLMMNTGAPVSDVMGFINDGVSGTLEKARSVTNINKGILASVATIKAHNPELDDKALIDAAAKGEFFNTDKDGNPVLKQDYSNVDPTQVGMRVLDIYKKNPELFYPAGSGDKALQGFINGQKLADVGEEPAYDAKGNRTGYGYKGKLPPLVSVQTDKNGKTVYDDKGKPKIDITGSANYRIPGQDHDYINNQGQTVKVVPTETYNQLPDPVKAEIEKEVKDQTTQAGVEPDSEYANMLRGNLAYNKLLGLASNTYKFNTPKDESFERKNALFSQRMREAGLGIAGQRLSLSREEMQIRKDRIAKGLDPDGELPDFLSNLADQAGEDVEVIDTPAKPAKTHWFSPNEPAVKEVTSVKKIIPVTADARDIDLIAGKPNSDGKRPIPPKTFTKTDGTTIEGWEYDPTTGNAFGDKGAKIERDAVQRNLYQTLKKGTLQHMESPSPLKKAKDAVNGVIKKIKGTEKSLY